MFGGVVYSDHRQTPAGLKKSKESKAAFAILWMGLRGEREGLPSMLATSFAEAAGVAGRQKWGLVLSSSARVSQVTYQTVVGIRYSELVTFNGTSWNFGKFVPHERPQVASSLFFGMFHAPFTTTYAQRHFSPSSSGRAHLSQIVNYSLFVLQNLQHLPTYGTSIASLFDG